MKYRKVEIKNSADESISLTHLDDTNKLHITVYQYGELKSI